MSSSIFFVFSSNERCFLTLTRLTHACGHPVIGTLSRADLGVERGQPFSLKFCIIDYRILRKVKSIYVAGKWTSGKVSRPPLSEFCGSLCPSLQCPYYINGVEIP